MAEVKNSGTLSVKYTRRTGLRILKNHGISEQLIEETLRQQTAFFMLPQEVKQKLSYEKNYAFHGFVNKGASKLKAIGIERTHTKAGGCNAPKIRRQWCLLRRMQAAHSTA